MLNFLDLFVIKTIFYAKQIINFMTKFGTRLQVPQKSIIEGYCFGKISSLYVYFMFTMFIFFSQCIIVIFLVIY